MHADMQPLWAYHLHIPAHSGKHWGNDHEHVCLQCASMSKWVMPISFVSRHEVRHACHSHACAHAQAWHAAPSSEVAYAGPQPYLNAVLPLYGLLLSRACFRTSSEASPCSLTQDADSDEDDSEGEAAGRKSAADLAGMRIRHGADELQEGEGMILTLADRNILDERGDLEEDGDELENVLAVSKRCCNACFLGNQVLTAAWTGVNRVAHRW